MDKRNEHYQQNKEKIKQQREEKMKDPNNRLKYQIYMKNYYNEKLKYKRGHSGRTRQPIKEPAIREVVIKRDIIVYL